MMSMTRGPAQPHEAAGDPPVDVLKCERCKDVIGAYEPMVVHEAGTVRTTSKAAEHGQLPGGECFHLECYTQASGQPAPR
jgi:hypothetical protein